MNVIDAVRLTNEPINFVDGNYPMETNRCGSVHPIYKVKCEKDICTNAKHWGIVGDAPYRSAIVWGENLK